MLSDVIPDGDKCLQSGLLASVGLLLHGYNHQNFLLEEHVQEEFNDLRLLDGQGEEMDLLKRLKDTYVDLMEGVHF